MTNRTKLEKALESLINGEEGKAVELFSSYIVETAAEIHQKMVEGEEDILEMEREVEFADLGDDLADEISADKDEIAAEESFEEDAEHDEAAEDLDIDLDAGEEVAADEGDEEFMDLEDLESGLEDLQADVDAVEDRVDGVEDTVDAFEKLAAEFKKIKDAEEVEHGEDFDNDGVLGAPEGEEVAADVDHVEGDENAIEESIELKAVKADMKDKTEKAHSPVGKAKDKLNLEGKPVKQTGPEHKGFDREDKKVGLVTKDTNTVKSVKDAIVKAAKVDVKDKAPGAGQSPAMPKN
jgi:hypothetical protein